jgi:SSS family transporter
MLGSETVSRGFHPIDWLIVALYMLASVGVGLWFTRKQKSLEDYFVAARSAPWWAVGISIIAANLSAITYMGSPAWVYEHDLQYDFGILFFPATMLLVVYLFVPFLARLRLFTIYEYLERRFNLVVRTFASALFLTLRGGWLATATYTQALGLSEITGIPLWGCVWMIGGVTATYTILGGMEAVLWTDVMQFFVLVGGIFVMLCVALVPFGGNLGEVWNIASAGGHTRMLNFDLNLMVEVTFWGVLIGNGITNLCGYGSDQLIVQRYLTTGSKRDMIRAVMINGIIVVPVVLLLDLVGLSFVAYYQTHPELRATLSAPSRVVPHFITNVLPMGLAGLVLAGILAATMSSLSAGYNSLSTASIIDFYRRFRRNVVLSEKTEMRAAHICTVFWAFGSTIAAMFVGQMGSIVQIMGKINGFFSGPLLGMFLLGMLTRRANSVGVLGGAVVGTATTAWVSYNTKVSWIWYSAIGCLATMLAGYALSYLRPMEAGQEVKQMTVWDGLNRAETPSTH